jgi:hypothetical protein
MLICVVVQMNLGGAKDRPMLTQVWGNIDAKLKGEKARFNTISTEGFCQMIWGKLSSLWSS